MLLYIFIALWPLFMLHLFENVGSNSLKRKKQYLYFAAFPMFALLAFRNDSLGADTYIYAKHFVDSINMPLEIALQNTRMEFGYVTFVKYLGYLTESVQLYQITCVCIYFVCYMSFAKQLEGNDGFLFLYFVCTLGLFMFMFTGVRQCIAISICLYSYKYLKRNKYWICFILLGLAFTFHKSSFLFLFAIFIWHRNLNWKYLSIYVVLLYIVSLYLLDAQMFFNEQLDYNYEIEETGSGQVFLTFILLLSILSWIVIKKNKPISLYEKGLFNVNIITLFFWFLRLQTRIAERPSYYFLTFSCALYAYAMNNLPSCVYKKIIRFSVIVLCLMLYVYRLSTNFSSFLPYKTFF